MEKTIKKLLLLLLVTFSTYSYGTNYYCFKPWKCKKVIPTEKIYFKVDPQKNYTFIITVINRIGIHLNSLGFSYEIIDQETYEKMTTKNELVLLFRFAEPDYVQLNPFDSKGGNVLCNQIEIIQIQPITEKLIETTASISMNDKEEGIKQFSEDFTTQLTKNLNIK